MEELIQELSDRVWSNPQFHETARRIELAWLARELGTEPPPIEVEETGKLVQAAAILACSNNPLHRGAAFRSATYAYELFGNEILPLDQALRVVLTRLGNFPSVGTRQQVNDALPQLPLALAAEEIASADEHAITVNGRNFYLTDFQRRLWSELTNKRRIALAAPTSAGKSFILQSFLSSAFEGLGSLAIVYIVPTRALIAQVADDLLKQFSEFSGDAPDVITVPLDVDAQLSPRAIYVMTQERVQIALNSHSGFMADLVVVDEAHSIADGSRGVLLQWVIDDLLERNPRMQILFASPTIRNLDIFSRLFGLPDIVEFSSTEPTVAQNFVLVTVEAASKGRIVLQTLGDGAQPPTNIATLQLDQTTASRVDKLVHISRALCRGQPSIIYANGAAEAEAIALQLAQLLAEHEPTPGQIALAELASEAVHGEYVLAECVKRGVAFHYSNIPTFVRRAVERAVSNGEITYLVCTSTLLQGVNLPAKNIFIFAPEKGRLKPMESTDFWNLAGRAGRLLREFHGNIFLIDYAKWKKKPLDAPKDSVVIPAIESIVKTRNSQLISVIHDQPDPSAKDTLNLETAFVRLYSDLGRGTLQSTFDRIGLPNGVSTIQEALEDAAMKVSLPPALIRQTPNVSAHKQQRLFNLIKERVDSGRPGALSIIPLHPRDSDAYQSYADILEACHAIILGIDTAKNLHRFHALMALRWMLGWPLPQIIDKQIERNPLADRRKLIRGTLELIENQIRFQAVRMFSCYHALLGYALHSAGYVELASSIPSLPVFLEVGASDRTMISFISLGLSRLTAMKLNNLSPDKNLDTAAAKEWLRTRPAHTLGLSPLLLAEIEAVMGTEG